jgi:hypothetical protein
LLEREREREREKEREMGDRKTCKTQYATDEIDLTKRGEGGFKANAKKRGRIEIDLNKSAIFAGHFIIEHAIRRQTR